MLHFIFLARPMATTNFPSLVLTINIFIVLSVIVCVSTAAAGKPRHPFHNRKEKLTHLHFYFHDTISGRHPTAMEVARARTTVSPISFGEVMIIDDPLTVSPDPKSKLLGRCQGIYASASQHDVGLLMAMNFAFIAGKYNGSNLSILGRNAIFSEVREMPVIGGSGLFRWARGYALARTHFINLTSYDAIVEYNVHVMHY